MTTSSKKMASQIKSREATGLLESPWAARQQREKQQQVKKEAVLLAAARLFTQKSFQGTSLDDIAQSLGNVV